MLHRPLAQRLAFGDGVGVYDERDDGLGRDDVDAS
jgi:hypothetical protein